MPSTYRDSGHGIATRSNAAEQAWAEQTSAVQEELASIEASIEEIVVRYQERLQALDTELQANLAPFRERLEILRQAITEMTAAFAPELPDRPTPDIDPPDESDWLFDASRDYLTQLDMYKARKVRAEEGNAAD
jgi:hypothetical protein